MCILYIRGCEMVLCIHITSFQNYHISYMYMLQIYILLFDYY